MLSGRDKVLKFIRAAAAIDKACTWLSEAVTTGAGSRGGARLEPERPKLLAINLDIDDMESNPLALPFLELIESNPLTLPPSEIGASGVGFTWSLADGAPLAKCFRGKYSWHTLRLVEVENSMTLSSPLSYILD